MSSPDSAEPTEAAPEPLSDAALTRLVLRAIGGLIALLLAAGLVAVAERADRDRNGGTAASSADEDEDPVLAVPFRGIGPLPGQPVEPYIQARTTELSRARGERVAVVSFTTYLAAATIRLDIDPGMDVKIVAVLVAAPGGEPAVLDSFTPAGMDAWARSERKQAAEERAELERLLPTVDDADFARSYREDIARLRALERAVFGADKVVFGAVVVGPVAGLQRLAHDGSVRLVDIGRDAEKLDDDEVVGLRPEETEKAGEPRYRPTTL